MCGRVALLVGPSCAGKSTLAKAIQVGAPGPVLAISLDGLFASVPERWGGGGEHADDGFGYRKLSDSHSDGGTALRIRYGHVGWRMLQGMHRAVAAHARAGVDVVVDDMLLDTTVLADWAEGLAGVPTLLVRLTAPLAELVRREQARTLHPTPGLVAGHFDLHEQIAADLVIDTSITAPVEAADLVLRTSWPAAGCGALHRRRSR
jgi:chloramphenicol 3-O phosphotransferase